MPTETTKKDPKTGLPYGSTSVEGEHAHDYVNPEDTEIGKGDVAKKSREEYAKQHPSAAAQGAALRTPAATPSPSPSPASKAPQRSDYPAGVVGESQYQRALREARNK